MQRPPSTLSSYQALLKAYAYDLTLTGESYARAFEALGIACNNDPECGLTAGAMAFMYADNIALEFFDLAVTPLDEAIKLAQKGVLIEPQNQLNRLALARLRMLNNELDTALAETEAALDLNPESLFYMDNIGLYLALLGEWDRGIGLIRKSIRLNPYYNRYAHFAIWLNWFRLHEYQLALDETGFLQGTGDFWDPLARAATLGQLGHDQDARSAVTELLAMKPDFHSRGRILIGHGVKERDTADRLASGLAAAGLVVE